MNCSTPGFPVLHHLPEFAHTHVHWVRDASQSSHPLSSPSPALYLSQHVQGLESSPTPQFKNINSSVLSLLYGPTLTSTHDSWKNHSFDYMNFVGKVMSLLFNMLSRLVITFLQGARVFLNFMTAVTICSDFGAQENKVFHCFIVSPPIFHEVMGPDAMSFVFWMLSFKPAFSLSSFTFIKRLINSSSLSATRVVSLWSEVIDISPCSLNSSLCFIHPSI